MNPKIIEALEKINKLSDEDPKLSDLIVQTIDLIQSEVWVRSNLIDFLDRAKMQQHHLSRDLSIHEKSLMKRRVANGTK